MVSHTILLSFVTAGVQQQQLGTAEDNSSLDLLPQDSEAKHPFKVATWQQGRRQKRLFATVKLSYELVSVALLVLWAGMSFCKSCAAA